MKTRNTVLLTGVILFMLVLSACSGGSLKDPLNGTAWALTSIDDTPPLEKTAVTVEFTDGKIGGSSGCNSYGGFYKVKGEKITTDSIAMTLMACADAGVMVQEQAFLEHLKSAKTFKLNENQLQLFNSEGKNLTFNRIP